jgi:hypothetical protein
MKRVWIAFMSVLLVSYNTYSQKLTAFASFKETSHDFGKIKEEKGAVTHVFEFINTGSNIVLVQNVQTSCGCTTPEYSKAPVKPGEKGFVKVVFDPNGRPGNFQKDITVHTNAENTPIVLKISGTVIPRTPTTDEIYRYTMGDVKLQSSHVGFNKITPGKVKTDTIVYLNSGKTASKIEFIKLPPHLQVKLDPPAVKPGKTGKIIISYDAKVKNDWGFLIDYLNLKVNNIEKPEYKITITADIGEDFSKMTEQEKANAPKIVFENTTHNFGNANAGSVVEHDFVFTNQGKSDLYIRKINSSCGCTTTTPKDKVVKPGTSSTITAKYNTTGNRNAQTKTVTVITNDPSNPQVTLWIKGTVQ